jgi:glycosyltransferase involved in cell wall biosynthesis
MRFGGADRFNLNLVEQLTRRGIAVTLCATIAGEHPWASRFANFTPDIFILPEIRTPEQYPDFFRELIISQKIDIVLISNSMLGYNFLRYLRAACPQVTFVDYNHMVATAWRSGGYARVAVNCQRYLDLNIVSSEQVKRWMVAQGAEEDRIEVCYTNQDVVAWDPDRYDRVALRHQLNIPLEVPVLLYPARLEPQKRPHLLVDILKGLRQRGQPFVGLVAGDGPQFQWLVNRLRQYGFLDAVRMLGEVAPETMPELMALSDILLLPSRDEGIALSLFEAMAMRLVPVSADVGGQRELVTPETGFLISKEQNELQNYVQVLARLCAQPDLRAQLGQAARERICAHFTLTQMADRMVRLLERAHQLAHTNPRPVISVTEGQVAAIQAVENVRLDRLQEMLRSDEPLDPTRAEPLWLKAWRQFIFRLKKYIFRPLYTWGIRSGLDWLEPLVNRVYGALRKMLW